MPTYEFSTQDGATYEIEAPDEATAIRAFQSSGAAPQAAIAPVDGAGFDERFGDGPMSRDVAAGASYANKEPEDLSLQDAMTKKADERLIGEPSAWNQFGALVTNWADAGTLNGARNLAALTRSTFREDGKPFEQEFQLVTDMKDAASRMYPKTAVAGTVGGIVNGAVSLPALGGAATLPGRALQAGATAGGYSAIAEFADSKDLEKTAKAGGIGFVAGGVAQGALEVAGKALLPLLTKKGSYRNPDGSLTDEAATALQRAGVDPALVDDRLDDVLASSFGRKGVSDATAREVVAGEFGIPLTRGQATSSPSQLHFEQEAARGLHGGKAQEIARNFADEQRAAADLARDGIAETAGRGRVSIGNPVEAGDIVGDGIKQAANTAKADFKGRYKDAFSRSGEFKPGTFNDVSQRIEGALVESADPVFIDEMVTPYAKRALTNLEKNPHLNLGGNNAPVTLKGLDQARKSLVQLYSAAKRAGNAEDLRALGRVMNEFDDRVERSITDGMFMGDEGVLKALKEARASYASYQKTFRPQGAGDDVGLALRKIIERQATPEETVNYLVGQSKVGARGVSVRLADRIERILGKDSQEWAAIRQAAWQRLTTTTEGTTPMTPTKIADRVTEFVNGEGSSLAKRLFTTEELGQMRRYGQALKVMSRDGGKNTNRTASAGAKMAKQAFNVVAAAVGAKLGGAPGAGAAYSMNIGEKLLGSGRMAQAVKGAPRVQKPLTFTVSPLSTGAGYAAGETFEP